MQQSSLHHLIATLDHCSYQNTRMCVGERSFTNCHCRNIYASFCLSNWNSFLMPKMKIVILPFHRQISFTQCSYICMGTIVNTTNEDKFSVFHWSDIRLSWVSIRMRTTILLNSTTSIKEVFFFLFYTWEDHLTSKWNSSLCGWWDHASLRSVEGVALGCFC